IAENQINVITVHASDTSAVTYSIIEGNDQSKFSIDSSSGALTFNTAPDFENPTDTGSDNIYEVTVRATDTSNNQAEQMISVTVTDVEDTLPVFTSNDAYTSPENKRYVTSDIHAQSTMDITYSITAGEDESKFAIDSYDGTLMFKGFPDYDIVGDFDGDNIYEATITATDTQTQNTDQDITVTLTNVDESIPKTYQVVSNLSNGVTTLNLGTTPKDVYLLFTNTHTTSSSTPTVSHNKFISTQSQKVYVSQSEIVAGPQVLHAPDYVQEFNSNSKNYFIKTATAVQSKILEIPEKNQDIVGEEQSFCTNINQVTGICIESTLATSRKVISDIITTYGTKTLNVWVSNDSFGIGCVKAECVTQEMVDELANSFLRNGLNNDIYDWVTNIYGEEWGSAAQAKYSNLIGADDEITILLTDIDNDDSAYGGVVGFFWSKDNFDASNIAGSNERVMFYIDSVMFANGDNGWDIDDFWPKELISTLAHEFQHMINFYQKYILLDTNTDTWINEMLSESTEDLVATKIHHIGPRGVDYTDGSDGDPDNTFGRYPLFNANNTLSLTAWNNELRDYSKVNAFGAYLIRNYGGVKVLHDIMHNSFENEQALVAAVQGTGKTFNDLLHEWGISVLLSDHIDAQRDQYSYNTNDFTVSLKEQTIYKMGSINFFNYFPEPNIETSMSTIEPQGNYYYLVGQGLTGDFNITITKGTNVIVSAVIKE
ncbi:MAG: cadherin domain-containing protein, partial [Melioribacteraceae bacterium]|nr:cadherin domain-containing protein [Melioribacteraceae bacterium]